MATSPPDPPADAPSPDSEPEPEERPLPERIRPGRTWSEHKPDLTRGVVTLAEQASVQIGGVDDFVLVRADRASSSGPRFAVQFFPLENAA